MYKKFVKFTFVFFCGCLELSNVYAMKPEDITPPASSKRPLKDQKGQETAAKSRKTISDFPFTALPQEAVSHMVPYLPKDEVWNIRLVSKSWWNSYNGSVTFLDLSSRNWVSWEKRKEIMESSGSASLPLQMRLPQDIFYNMRTDAQNLENWQRCSFSHTFDANGNLKKITLLLKKEDSPDINITLTGLSISPQECLLYREEGEPLSCKDSEKIWKLPELVFGDRIKFPNPFLEDFAGRSVTFKEFPYLQCLNLSNNEAITNEDLEKVTSLLELNLSGSKKITSNIVSLLTNLTTLNLQDVSEENIAFKSLLPLTNLQKLTIDGTCKDIQDMPPLLNSLKELRILDSAWDHRDFLQALAEFLWSCGREHRNHPNFLPLETLYNKRILVANALNLGEGEATWDSDPKQPAQFTFADMKYIKELTAFRYKAKAKVNTPKYKERYMPWNNPWERNLYEIINGLLKIMDIKLTILLGNNDEVVSLEKLIEKSNATRRPF